MTSTSSPQKRALFLLLPMMFLTLAGCGLNNTGYPRSMRYPPRKDPLVAQPPTATPFHPIAPGKLNEHITLLMKATQQTENKDPKLEAYQNDGKYVNPADLDLEARKAIDYYLTADFGTPAEPTMPRDFVSEADETLKLHNEILSKGSILYRRHCLNCHGVAGDGRGPTGPWVSPHPRDYRQGTFKFTSTGTRPTRDDLIRTLRVGIPGTSMPSHGLLPDEEIEALVSYVIHLSIRGEVEFQLLKEAPGKDAPDEEKKQFVEEYAQTRSQEQATSVIQSWVDAQQKAIQPGGYTSGTTEKELEESIRNGFKTFVLDKGANCLGCHQDYGRQVQFRYDKWGTMTRPANLTTGIYRGGRRPIDIYWRIRAGIDIGPAGMPKANFAKDPEKTTWDLVNFVLALPHPERLPKDIREEIYGPSRPATHKTEEKSHDKDEG